MGHPSASARGGLTIARFPSDALAAIERDETTAEPLSDDERTLAEDMTALLERPPGSTSALDARLVAVRKRFNALPGARRARVLYAATWSTGWPGDAA